MELSEVKLVVRGLLMSAQDGLSVRHLLKDFADEEGTALPFKELGFNNPIAFLLSIPDVVQFHSGSPDINSMAYPVASDNNKHIAELVAGQNSKKKSRSRSLRRPVSRPGYNRSYSTYPSKGGYSSYNNSYEKAPRFQTSWQKEYVSNHAKTSSTQRERTSWDSETSKYQDKENCQNDNARSYPRPTRSQSSPNRDEYYQQQRQKENNEPHEKGKAGPTPSDTDACKEKCMSHDSSNKPSYNFPRSHDSTNKPTDNFPRSHDVPISSASQSITNESHPAPSISNISPSIPQPVAKFIRKFAQISKEPPPPDRANSKLETTTGENLPIPVPHKDPPAKLPPWLQLACPSSQGQTMSHMSQSSQQPSSGQTMSNISQQLSSGQTMSNMSHANQQPSLGQTMSHMSQQPSSGQTMSHMSQGSQQPGSGSNRLHITTNPRPEMNQPVNYFTNQIRPLMSLPYSMPQGIDPLIYLNLMKQNPMATFPQCHPGYVGAPLFQHVHQPQFNRQFPVQSNIEHQDPLPNAYLSQNITSQVPSQSQPTTSLSHLPQIHFNQKSETTQKTTSETSQLSQQMPSQLAQPNQHTRSQVAQANQQTQSQGAMSLDLSYVFEQRLQKSNINLSTQSQPKPKNQFEYNKFAQHLSPTMHATSHNHQSEPMDISFDIPIPGNISCIDPVNDSSSPPSSPAPPSPLTRPGVSISRPHSPSPELPISRPHSPSPGLSFSMPQFSSATNFKASTALSSSPEDPDEAYVKALIDSMENKSRSRPTHTKSAPTRTSTRTTSSTSSSRLDREIQYVGKRMHANLVQLMADHPEGIRCSDLPSLYEETYKVPLCIRDYVGDSGVIGFVERLTTVFKVLDLDSGEDWILLDPKQEIPAKYRHTDLIPNVIEDAIVKILQRCRNGFFIDEFPKWYEQFYRRPINLADYPKFSWGDVVAHCTVANKVARAQRIGDRWFFRPISKDAYRPPDPEVPVVPAEWALHKPMLKIFESQFVLTMDRLTKVELPDTSMCAEIQIILQDGLSPYKLSAILYENQGKLNEMMDDLNEVYNAIGRDQLQMDQLHISRGNVCIARYGSDDFRGDWHRCKILRILDSNRAKLLYLDFGTIGYAPCDQLKYMTPDYATLPLQCLYVSLYRVYPVDVDPGTGLPLWNRKGLDKLLTKYENVRVTATVFYYDPKEPRITAWITALDTQGCGVELNKEFCDWGFGILDLDQVPLATQLMQDIPIPGDTEDDFDYLLEQILARPGVTAEPHLTSSSDDENNPNSTRNFKEPEAPKKRIFSDVEEGEEDNEDLKRKCALQGGIKTSTSSTVPQVPPTPSSSCLPPPPKQYCTVSPRVTTSMSPCTIPLVPSNRPTVSPLRPMTQSYNPTIPPLEGQAMIQSNRGPSLEGQAVMVTPSSRVSPMRPPPGYPPYPQTMTSYPPPPLTSTTPVSHPSMMRYNQYPHLPQDAQVMQVTYIRKDGFKVTEEFVGGVPQSMFPNTAAAAMQQPIMDRPDPRGSYPYYPNTNRQRQDSLTDSSSDIDNTKYTGTAQTEMNSGIPVKLTNVMSNNTLGPPPGFTTPATNVYSTNLNTSILGGQGQGLNMDSLLNNIVQGVSNNSASKTSGLNRINNVLHGDEIESQANNQSTLNQLSNLSQSFSNSSQMLGIDLSTISHLSELSAKNLSNLSILSGNKLSQLSQSNVHQFANNIEKDTRQMSQNILFDNDKRNYDLNEVRHINMNSSTYLGQDMASIRKQTDHGVYNKPPPCTLPPLYNTPPPCIPPEMYKMSTPPPSNNFATHRAAVWKEDFNQSLNKNANEATTFNQSVRTNKEDVTSFVKPTSLQGAQKERRTMPENENEPLRRLRTNDNVGERESLKESNDRTAPYRHPNYHAQSPITPNTFDLISNIPLTSDEHLSPTLEVSRTSELTSNVKRDTATPLNDLETGVNNLTLQTNNLQSSAFEATARNSSDSSRDHHPTSSSILEPRRHLSEQNSNIQHSKTPKESLNVNSKSFVPTSEKIKPSQTSHGVQLNVHSQSFVPLSPVKLNVQPLMPTSVVQPVQSSNDGKTAEHKSSTAEYKSSTVENKYTSFSDLVDDTNSNQSSDAVKRDIRLPATSMSVTGSTKSDDSWTVKSKAKYFINIRRNPVQSVECKDYVGLKPIVVNKIVLNVLSLSSERGSTTLRHFLIVDQIAHHILDTTMNVLLKTLRAYGSGDPLAVLVNPLPSAICEVQRNSLVVIKCQREPASSSAGGLFEKLALLGKLPKELDKVLYLMEVQYVMSGNYFAPFRKDLTSLQDAVAECLI